MKKPKTTMNYDARQRYGESGNSSYLPTTQRTFSSSRPANVGAQMKIGTIFQPNLGGFVVGNDSMVEWCAFGNWCRFILGIVLCPAMIFFILLALAALGLIGTQFF